MQMVQPSQSLTLPEQPNQLYNWFWGNGFKQLPRYVFTNFYTTSEFIQQFTIHHTTHSHTQEEYPQILTLQHNKTTTDKVTEYHNITPIFILILIEEEWEDKIHITITKIETILGRMIDNKGNQMDIYSLFSLDYEHRFVHIMYMTSLMVKNFKYYW